MDFGTELSSEADRVASNVELQAPFHKEADRVTASTQLSPEVDVAASATMTQAKAVTTTFQASCKLRPIWWLC